MAATRSWIGTLLRLFVASYWLFPWFIPELKAVDDVMSFDGPAVSTLPLEIAARKGFFRDEGMEI